MNIKINTFFSRIKKTRQIVDTFKRVSLYFARCVCQDQCASVMAADKTFNGTGRGDMVLN